MDNQEVFNKVWDWFVVQKKPQSLNKSGYACAYRGRNGARCAVGVIIPDDVYDKAIEGTDINGLLIRISWMKQHEEQKQFAEKLERFFQEFDIEFLRKIQYCHDDASSFGFTVYMEKRLRNIALNYRLQIPE